jgi:hypothetical protein
MRFALIVSVALACSPQSSPADAAADSMPDDSASADVTQSDVAQDAAATDTWASYAQGFFQTYCNACHMSGSSLEPSMPSSLYFTSEANVDSQKSVIRCGVCVTQDASWSCPSSPAAKQFPIGSGPFPSDAERNRIVAWITAGAP